MLFNSFEFLIFFPVVVIMYFLLPFRFRWVLLLAASYFFYMSWKMEYALLLAGSTLVDYYAALRMEALLERAQRKKWLILSLCSNLGILAVFKYSDFFYSNVVDVANAMGSDVEFNALKLLLPVGISFYTFQTLSYSIDVYRGMKAEKHLGKFALYVSFFPQLVAGPIERASRLLPQFGTAFHFHDERVKEGLKQMLWGLFKKIVIADRLAVIVNMAYNDTGSYEGSTLLLATYCFAIQIYCDFSGYSDIAIGAAKVMGYDLMDNFKVPYLSRSIREFWSRWHISLSTWFRDYLYIPLGGNKVVRWRWYYNLFIVFVVSGFWHGANWTFIIWGALHGLYLVGGILLGDNKAPKKGQWWRILLTFHLVLLAWVFFRANHVSDAFEVLQKIVGGDWNKSVLMGLVNEVGASYFAISMGILLLFLVADPLMDKLIKKQYTIQRSWINYGLYAVIFTMIMLFGHFGEIEFIYFQF